MAPLVCFFSFFFFISFLFCRCLTRRSLVLVFQFFVFTVPRVKGPLVLAALSLSPSIPQLFFFFSYLRLFHQ
jgi:hypothetical protein